ncbi:hypothetical protein B0J14DRAFT_598835 [Halenospora varia]|nr:hypothetical protein B0J14DRAFT_598835 [Halenospora varia]
MCSNAVLFGLSALFPSSPLFSLTSHFYSCIIFTQLSFRYPGMGRSLVSHFPSTLAFQNKPFTRKPATSPGPRSKHTCRWKTHGNAYLALPGRQSPSHTFVRRLE